MKSNTAQNARKKVILTSDQAKKLLPAKECIHTFRSAAAGILIGVDWNKADLEAEIDKCICELSGPHAQAMKHGLAVHTQQGPLFVETNETSDNKTQAL